MHISNCLKRLSLVSALMLSACGTRQQLDTLRPDLAVTGNGAVAIAVHDVRPCVQSGNKNPSFVGLVRSGWGIPYDVSTTSGHPLSSDIAHALCNGFEAKSAPCTEVETTPAQSERDIARSLAATGARKLFLLTIHQWKSDVLTYGELFYDLTLSTVDSRGVTTQGAKVAGRDELGGSMWAVAPGAKAAKAAEAKLKEKLEELLRQLAAQH